MAAIANAFDLLKGQGEAGPAASKAKKKKAKAKPKAESAGADAAPAAAAAAPEPAAPRSGGGAVEAVVDHAQAIPLLEKSARSFKSGGDRVKLWKDWIRQAGDRSAKALKYKADNGSFIQFKELLLRSRALEITVESCITSPLTPEQTTNLEQLLSTFIPGANPAALAVSIARLAHLLAEDAQGFDTVGAAQRAVHKVIGTLKVASPDTGGAGAAKPATLGDRLANLDKEVAKQRSFLASVEKLAADPKARAAGAQGSSGVSKAHVNSAKELVGLLGEKFDLLQGNGTTAASQGGGGPGEAAVKTLEELKDVINGHLQEARSLEGSANAKGGGQSKEAQRAQAVAALRREEAVLAQQAADVAGQIRTLESQLAQLRSQAADLEDKRVRLQQRQAAALDALTATTGRKVSGRSASHYSEELAAANSLIGIVDPSRAPRAGADSAAAQAASEGSAADYMGAVRSLLQMTSSSLADVPGRVVFCRQRIAQAEKLSSLGGLGKEKSAKTREEAEKLLGETVKGCEEILAGAQAALEGMRSRFPSFSPEQQAELSQAAYEVEDMMAHIKTQHELAMAAVRGQQAPAAAAAAAPQLPYGAAVAAAAAVPAAGAAALAGGSVVAAPGAASAGSLGPIRPPSTAGALSAAPAANGHAAKPAPVPVAAAAPKARPVSAAAAVAAAPPAQSADGFTQVGGKKNRRRA